MQMIFPFVEQGRDIAFWYTLPNQHCRVLIQQAQIVRVYDIASKSPNPADALELLRDAEQLLQNKVLVVLA